MNKNARTVAAAAIFLIADVGCAQKHAEAPPAPPSVPFKIVATSKQLMQAIVIPAADVVWKVPTEAPKNDAEWLAVENSALAIAESANLLMMDGRAVDHENWMKESKALSDAAIAAAEGAHAKNAEKVGDAGNALYDVCEACHMQYMKQEPDAPPAAEAPAPK
jgi:hypothetical protein